MTYQAECWRCAYRGIIISVSKWSSKILVDTRCPYCDARLRLEEVNTPKGSLVVWGEEAL